MGKAHSWLPSTKKLFVNPSVFLLYLVFYDGPGPEPEPLSFFSCPSIFSVSPSVRILRRLIRRHLVLSCFPSFTVIIGSVNYGNLLTLSLPTHRMISDPKSAHFISWNDLGTSFVVSNVGEFSRNILGSHFKHNNVRLIFFRFIFFFSCSMR
jgi:hypothetical protein